MLVLKFRQKSDGLRNNIYRDTLDYIGNSMSNAVIYEYKNDQNLIDFIQKNKLVIVVSTRELSYRTSVMLKGLNLIQILIGENKDLKNVVDIIIDPLLKKSNEYHVGTKYLLPSILIKYLFSNS